MYPNASPPLVTYGMLFIALALAALFVLANRQAAVALGAPPAEVARRTWLAGDGRKSWRKDER